MAQAAGVSVSSVQRIWRVHGLRPHLVRRFKLSNDLQFAAKLKEIVGLYVNPPDHAVVLAVDEKSQIQALDRTQPGLPMKKGRAGTMTHDVWSGRALQESSSSCLIAVLHQCIRPLIGAIELRAIMDISARAISLTDRPRPGHVGHQCSHAPGRPILHLVSSSRRPRRVSRIDLATSSRAPHFRGALIVGLE